MCSHYPPVTFVLVEMFSGHVQMEDTRMCIGVSFSRVVSVSLRIPLRVLVYLVNTFVRLYPLTDDATNVESPSSCWMGG